MAVSIGSGSKIRDLTERWEVDEVAVKNKNAVLVNEATVRQNLTI